MCGLLCDHIMFGILYAYITATILAAIDATIFCCYKCYCLCAFTRGYLRDHIFPSTNATVYAPLCTTLHASLFALTRTILLTEFRAP